MAEAELELLDEIDVASELCISFFFNETATTEIYTFPTRRSSDLEGLVSGFHYSGNTSLLVAADANLSSQQSGIAYKQ